MKDVAGEKVKRDKLLAEAPMRNPLVMEPPAVEAAAGTAKC